MDLWLSTDHGLAFLSASAFLLVSLSIATVICTAVYRIYFGPLSKFPGPRLFAASYFPHLYLDKVQGTFPKDVLKLHQTYGPIVRVSPNRLAVDGSIGWSEIFARRPTKPEFEKSVEFYGFQERVGILVSFRDDHRRQRSLLSHAFSATALQEQETYIMQYLAMLMKRLWEHGESGEPADMTRMYNYTTFDIIGELAFGDSFQCLERNDYHPWVAMIFAGIRFNTRAIFFNRYSWLRPLTSLVLGKDELQDKDKQRTSEDLATEKTEKRMALGEAERKDFMTYILRHNKDGKGMTKGEIVVNARTLIIAGSETTATALSGLTFFLTQDPEIYRRLTTEIRDQFSSAEEINLRSTERLQYLHACIEEVLRVYPPAVETPPRISPPGGDYVDGKYIPEGTYLTIYQWATNQLDTNFKDPSTFAPERFLPPSHPLYESRFQWDNKAAFRPFAAGPRDCVGKNLAYAEMRLIMARVLWEFEFELVEGQKDWASQQRVFTVFEKPPLMIKLKPVIRT